MSHEHRVVKLTGNLYAEGSKRNDVELSVVKYNSFVLEYVL